MATTNERIKEAMDIRGLKQVDLVEKTGISKGSISGYISGSFVPKQNYTALIARALNVDEAWLMGKDVPMERKLDIPNRCAMRKTVTIPVYGRIAAGIPLEMIEDIIDTEEITEDMARRGTYFCLSIHGHSMEPRMCEGDVVVCRRQPEAEDGEIVIATVNSTDATCKRLKKYTDGIALVSTNPAFEPMHFTSKEVEELPVRIIGKVVELRAKFEKDL